MQGAASSCKFIHDFPDEGKQDTKTISAIDTMTSTANLSIFFRYIFVEVQVINRE